MFQISSSHGRKCHAFLSAQLEAAGWSLQVTRIHSSRQVHSFFPLSDKLFSVKE